MSLIAHPRGPEGRQEIKRNIEIQGADNILSISFESPEPDRVIDHTNGKPVRARETNGGGFYAVFEYAGHFWQGTFGSWSIETAIIPRHESDKPMASYEDLRQVLLNQISRSAPKAPSTTVLENLKQYEPKYDQLNGFPCLKSIIKAPVGGSEETEYFLFFDAEKYLRVRTSFVDNSGRKGLPQSDWRQRATKLSEAVTKSLRIQIRKR